VGYAKLLLYSIGKILRGVHKITPVWYGKKFAWGTQNYSYMVWERFCVGYIITFMEKFLQYMIF